MREFNGGVAFYGSVSESVFGFSQFIKGFFVCQFYIAIDKGLVG